MTISAPVILYPKTNWVAGGSGSTNNYYSDSLVQMISGYIPVTSADYQANAFFTVQYSYRIYRDGAYVAPWSAYSEVGITAGTTFEGVQSVAWSLNTEDIIDLEVLDVISFDFQAVKREVNNYSPGIILETSGSEYLDATIISELDIVASVDPPTGYQIKQASTYIKLMLPREGILLNTNSDFAGCSFYLSMDAGGGSGGYQRMNDVPVTDPDATETELTNEGLDTVDDLVNNMEITTTKTIQKTIEYYTFSFTKDVLTQMIMAGKIPNVFLADGISLNPDQSYYLTCTALAYDHSLDQLVESSFCIELEGKFIYFNDTYRALPERQRGDILFSISRDMMVNNNLINVIPASVIRDILDPISLVFEKFYTIQDFIFTTYSLDALLAFDDANGDGISDPLSMNVRKRRLADALGVTDETSFQLLIDEQFDKIAGNSNLTRNAPRKSTGTVTFFMKQTPTVDILIPDGTVVVAPADADTKRSAVGFVVRGSKIIDSSNPARYYNASLKRYELIADIEAQSAGATSNVPAGAITSVQGLSSIVQVINDSPTLFGSDRESNTELATRIKLAPISYDSGTEPGYMTQAYKVPTVIETRVQAVGDPLMMRDYDVTDRKHIGGKVDIYVRGGSPLQLSDQVAFKYEYPTDVYGSNVGEQFDITDAQEFRIKTKNTKVGVDSPIALVNRVRNITRSSDYDLTNYSIVGDGDTIILSKTISNVAIGMATFDVVEVNYKYRSSNMLTLSTQPVLSLVSVTDHTGTIIDTSKYRLVKLEDPLLNGNSSIAKDSVQFFFNAGDVVEFINIGHVYGTGPDEEQDMLLNTPARLNYKGVNIANIVVFNLDDNTDIYKKDIDYSVTSGNEVNYTYLNLLTGSKIRHGDRVGVSYQASENFNVVYTTSSLVSQVQTKANTMKHACADAIVKVAVGNPVDISFRVMRKSGQDATLLKSRLQTSVANYVSNLKMGETFSQGSLINVIQTTTGVKEIMMPIIRLAKRNASFIPLDDLGQLNFEVYHKTMSGGVISYRSIDSVLRYPTSDNGGDSNFFRTVYEDNISLTMVSDPADVSDKAGQAYIQSDGKIIVSTTDGLPPQLKYYKAAYYVYYSAETNVVEDIETGEIEYLVVDSLSLRDIEVIDERIVKRGL